MNISLNDGDPQIIIDSLLLQIKELKTQVETQTKDYDKDKNTATDEILALYRFIESKDETAEMLDFVYEKAKNGDLDDINVAISTFDYYSEGPGGSSSEARWHELNALKTERESEK
ncbi:hypothetical protein [uncultured Psychrobacter sp.]|uniref:hypothetical protein n=1 Tax=uncultured Psychrobacter sp. TaxID=259303 RepID=UPI0030DAE8E1